MTLASELGLDPFAFFRQFVRERSGILLTEEKRYLVETRLAPVAKRAGLGDLAGLMRAVRRPNPDLETAVVDAMTTNETSWFRDRAPFEALRQKALPDRIAANARRRQLSIWSAACSTGQEPYSLAMVIDSHFPELADWSIDLLATDLCESALARARAGRFSALEINRGLPAPNLLRYFSRNGADFELDPRLRKQVRFQQLNLTRPWPCISPQDVIFLRNVLIYFDLDTKKQVLGAMRAQLRPGGFLVLGAAETTRDLVAGFRPVAVAQTTIYQLEEGRCTR